MKWFCVDGSDGDLTQEQSELVLDGYRRHVDALRREAPALVELLDLPLRYGQVHEWHASDDTVAMRLVVGDLESGYEFAAVTYRGASIVGGAEEPRRLRLDDEQTEILYDEVDRDGARFVHRLRLWPTGEITVTFDDVEVVRSPATRADRDRLAPVDVRLAELCTALADLTGYDAPPDWRDEHERWWLYQAAATRPLAAPSLQAAVGLEPVEGIATGVVLAAFDSYPSARRDWIAALPVERRPFVSARARELDILDVVMAGDPLADANVADWSRWLQRSVVDRSTNRAVLERLASEGMSKKIRNIAADALRTRARLGRGRDD
ncbi:hypothetical protein [Cellulomonas sp.]|uniref:hypothetical protein n=1 Tax=Cellulomonas sp. TaxID=40001 RepID=UPI001B1379EE|nr:hypothetical protein [Cellulomonas sp.]MBO9555037.1 hypothetical protein [Cellulomonas sp.]